MDVYSIGGFTVKISQQIVPITLVNPPTSTQIIFCTFSKSMLK